MINKINEETTVDTAVSINFTKEYKTFLNELKNEIRSSRLTATLAINCEVIKLYWYIGKGIIKKQSWGNKFIEVLWVHQHIPHKVYNEIFRSTICWLTLYRE